MTVHGIDISGLQPEHPAVAGSDFVVIKASEGHTFANARRGEQAKTARSAGKVVGWYHFLWPGSIQAQAAWFIKCAAPRSGDFLACDWETTGDKTAASCAEKDAFLAAVKKLRPGLRVLLYCNLSFWKGRDTTSQAGDGLWIADPDAPAGAPRVEHPWVLHQYGIRGVDQDVANFKSAAAMRTWAGVPAPKPNPPANKPPVKPTPPAKPPARPKPTYVPPRFPAGLGPGKSKPSALSLQKALRQAGFLHIADGDLSDVYGPRTQAAAVAFHTKYPQFRAAGITRDPAIGPKGWAFLFTLAYGK